MPSGARPRRPSVRATRAALNQWSKGRPVTGPPLAEVGILAGLVATHVLDHRVVPEEVHVGTHLATAATTVVAAIAAGASLDDLGLAPSQVKHGLRRGVLVSAGITGVLALAAAYPPTRQFFVDERVAESSGGQIAFRSLVEIPFGTAVSEELIFRGAVLGLADRRMPTVAAVGTTSALFGLWHVLPALADREHNAMTEQRHPLAVVGATVGFTSVAGLMFAYERLRSGSVVAPVLSHTATNVATYLIATVVARRSGS